MESYELYIDPPKVNPVNGRFLPGHKPFNKGKKWIDYMDMRKSKRVKKNLEIRRKMGNKKLAGANRIPIVGIKEGKLIAYKSSIEAAKILRAQGIKINARNIRYVCAGTINKSKFGKYEYNYIRKRAGGYQWFYADDTEKYRDLLK